ncbi:MAG: hypothetical protein K2M94_07360 [Paramuribaculum sp.]|nr:hypothetical protein [Paramuribaculum sp.]
MIFSEYPYNDATEKKFMDRVFGNSRPAKFYDHYMYETGFTDDGTPYYAKVYFGSEALYEETMNILKPFDSSKYDPKL